MPTVRIPEPFRQYTGGEAYVLAAGSTVGEALDDLLQQFPTLRQHLYDNTGDLITTTHESINILLDKFDIRELDGPDTRLKESDRLMILRTWPAAISGGGRKD
ncbi:MAG: molybdopterin synthase sulfur carrier subunit [Anaerolineae bacterium]|nr:molybdopterin synthase sulfur carrier subunit [Anaerolineae bacterium]